MHIVTEKVNMKRYETEIQLEMTAEQRKLSWFSHVPLWYAAKGILQWTAEDGRHRDNNNNQGWVGISNLSRSRLVLRVPRLGASDAREVSGGHKRHFGKISFKYRGRNKWAYHSCLCYTSHTWAVAVKLPSLLPQRLLGSSEWCDMNVAMSGDHPVFCTS